MLKTSAFPSHIEDVNLTYIRRSEDVQDVSWTSYVRSIYVLYPGSCVQFMFCPQEVILNLHPMPRKLRSVYIMCLWRYDGLKNSWAFFVYLLLSIILTMYWLHHCLKIGLKISSVNLTKSKVSCGFGHINWRNS